MALDTATGQPTRDRRQHGDPALGWSRRRVPPAVILVATVLPVIAVFGVAALLVASLRQPDETPAPLATSAATGYVQVAGDGGLFAFGQPPAVRTLGDTSLTSPITAATADGTGHVWLAAADGGVFALAGAPFYGSAASQPLAARIVDIAARPNGDGYWLLAADGGLFAFGAAPFLGTVADEPGVGAVTAIESTPSGEGYWVLAANGGVYTFGDAASHSRLAQDDLPGAAVDLAASPTGRGYWVALDSGTVFAFGDAPEVSGGSDAFASPVVAIEPTPSGHGYWLTSADGRIAAYGNARMLGSMAGTQLAEPIVTLISFS